MRRTIFYAWQSDLPSLTNRDFIQGCLKRSIGALRVVSTELSELTIDRDTHSEPGTPEIAAAILKKIDVCTAFVADVSVVTPRRSTARPIPNPNVLLELGYAASARGWDRILCVCNEAYGAVEDLPFDMRHRRLIPYKLRPNDESRAHLRRQLVSELTNHLRGILSGSVDRLARELRAFLDQIDPSVVAAIRRGERELPVEVPAALATEFQRLSGDPDLRRLVQFVDSANFLWTDARGPRNGYHAKFTDEFAARAT